MIDYAPIGTLTQGTLFSCALAEDYPDCVVHGLVITARCDITNDKADVYNYVPVVKFKDWLTTEAVRVLADRAFRASFGDLKQRLLQSQFAPSILDTLSPEDVHRTLFESSEFPKIRAQAPAFKKVVERCATASRCLGRDFQPTDAQAVIKMERKEADRLVKELCQNAIAEVHFLPSVTPEEDCDGYVVLLREVKHIPRDLAKAIAYGLDQKGLAAICEGDGRQRNRLQIEKDDFSWPTGVLQSPFVEHLMQRLTNLFARIGVTDVKTGTIDRLLDAITAIEARSNE